MKFSIHPSPSYQGVTTLYDVHADREDGSATIAASISLSDAQRIVEGWERVRPYVEPMMLAQRDIIVHTRQRLLDLASLLERMEA